MQAVVTGSTGFVGRALMARLAHARALHLASADWREQIAQADYRGAAVLHLAARVHDTSRTNAWHLDNVEKTQALARAAAAGGATRFVFMSTLKVHGEETGRQPFRPEDALRPEDEYARSKALAEEGVRRIASETGLAFTIVRSPLVFGRSARANLDRVMRLAQSGLPLPFAGIANRRSWIHVDDLCTLLLACATHGGALNRVFIACHPEVFSTPHLLRGLRARLGVPSRLFTIPARVLEAAAIVAGQREAVRRLTRSLEGDASDAMERLQWLPRISFEGALDDLVGRAPA